MKRSEDLRGPGPTPRGLALIAMAVVGVAALSGCHSVGGLDLVNDCAVPIEVFGGVNEPSQGTSTEIYFARPAATIPAYYVKGADTAIFYVRTEGTDDWSGPLEVPVSPADGAVVRFPVQGVWCE